EMLCLLVIPTIAAAVVGLLGPRRVHAIRWISFVTAVISLVLTTSLSIQLMTLPRGTTLPSIPTFRPEFVPGSMSLDPVDPKRHATTWDVLPLGPGAIQFFVGLDGLNVWLVMLTGVLFVPSVLVSWHAI